MALSCWNRFSVRGSTLVRKVAMDDSGISVPPGPETWMSPKSDGVRRPERCTWGITL